MMKVPSSRSKVQSRNAGTTAANSRTFRHPAVSSSPGFTIMELMVASMVFAVILLVLAVGVIRFSNAYYKGITSSKTQAAARSIIASISQTIEFGKTVTVIPPDANGVAGLCVDNMLYSYELGVQVTDTSPNSALHQGHHGLVVSSGSACTSGTTPSLPSTTTLPSGSRELLGQHMRLSALTISNAGNVYTVRLRIIYGDDDLLRPVLGANPVWANERCSGLVGSQFCAVSDLTTTVERRLL